MGLNLPTLGPFSKVFEQLMFLNPKIILKRLSDFRDRTLGDLENCLEMSESGNTLTIQPRK